MRDPDHPLYDPEDDDEDHTPEYEYEGLTLWDSPEDYERFTYIEDYDDDDE